MSWLQEFNLKRTFAQWRKGYDTDNKYWRKTFFFRRAAMVLMVFYLPTIIFMFINMKLFWICFGIIIILDALCACIFTVYDSKYTNHQFEVNSEKARRKWMKPSELKREMREKKLKRILSK